MIYNEAYSDLPFSICEIDLNNGEVLNFNRSFKKLIYDKFKPNFTGKFNFNELEKADPERIDFVDFLKTINSHEKSTYQFLSKPNVVEEFCLVKSNSDEERNLVLISIDVATHLNLANQKIRLFNEILEIINDIQLKTFIGKGPTDCFEEFLIKILTIVKGDFGFIGEVGENKDDKFSLKSFSFSYLGDANNELSSAVEIQDQEYVLPILKIFEDSISRGDFLSADSRALKSISLPGILPVQGILGIPIFKGQQYLGYLGLLCETDCFLEEEVEMLTPILGSYANLLESKRLMSLRKESEKLKEKYESLFRIYAENGDDILAILKTDFRIDFISPSVTRVLGLDAEEIQGKLIWETFVHLPPSSTFYEIERRIVVPILSRKTNKDLFFEFSIKPLLDEKGFSFGYLAIGRDVTEREKTLKSFREIAFRERELNRLKSGFVSMVSHELRTPLATILSSSHLLNSQLTKSVKPDESKVKNHIQKIIRQTNRLSKIFDNVMTLEKSIQLDKPSQEIKINLKPFFKMLLKDLVEDHPDSIELIEPEEDVVIWSDPSYLILIFSNLMKNSIKFSDGIKKPVLKFFTQNEELVVELRDFGIGIPDEDQGHIFETFFRASNSKHIKGTGLGLKIVKEILEKLKGHISFESKLGEGTKFIVELPINEPKKIARTSQS